MAKSYTKINNDLISGLARLKLKSPSSYMVLFAIIRNTLCYHKNQHELSNDFLANATGLNRRSVIRGLKELEAKKIIKVVSKSCGSHPKLIRILSDNLVTVTDTVAHSDNPVTEKGDNPDTIYSDNPVTQEIKEIKDINKREKKKPDFFSSMEEAKQWYEDHPEELEDDDV